MPSFSFTAAVEKCGEQCIYPEKESFDRQELFRVLGEQYKGLSQASYKLKMQRLLESGEIARVGRNLYCIPDKQMTIYDYEYSHLAAIVREMICEKYPGKILLNPSVKEYHLYWQEDLIVVGKLLTEAPKGKKAV